MVLAIGLTDLFGSSILPKLDMLEHKNTHTYTHKYKSKPYGAQVRVSLLWGLEYSQLYTLVTAL